MTKYNGIFGDHFSLKDGSVFDLVCTTCGEDAVLTDTGSEIQISCSCYPQEVQSLSYEFLDEIKRSF